jgi:8-oxo-dGTP pyrophosphatase MutT (NUDIX family)
LPKGKVEKGEDFEQAAVREIEEETGVQATLKQFLCSTFHTYQVGDKLYLKETKWYRLVAKSLKKALPQTEEGITEAVWKEHHQTEEMLRQSYLSIKLVYEAYLKQKFNAELS